MKIQSIFLIAGLLLTLTLGAAAQQYSIDWYTVDGGGGTSTSAVYSVTGTIGQPDAGTTMNGGNFALTGGFWSIVTAVQTPGAPLLSILRNTGGVILSWPSPSTGYLLQKNTDLNTTNWVQVLTTPSDDGTNKTVTVTPAAGNWYFRLKK
jgi:hypothetical protein